MSNIIRRTFTTTAAVQRTYRFVTQRRIPKQPDLQIGDIKPWNVEIPKNIPTYPIYKYGESHYYKQSNHGLYGGQFLGSGNKVAENGHKTPRKWKVNVIRKHLWSEALQKSIKMKTTGRVLRTLKKEGGLDNYLLKEKSARLKELGPRGYKLKYDVLMAKEKLIQSQKPVPRVRDSEGELHKVYHVVEIDNIKYKFKVGKQKILNLLYQNLRKDHIEEYKWMEFSVEHQPKSVSELTRLLLANDIDFSLLIVN